MAVTEPTLERELRMLQDHAALISVDEVGRGALAGPVAVGAVRFTEEHLHSAIPEGLRDSKLVSEKKRPGVAERAAAWVPIHAVGWASAQEVDDVGILRALGLAASRAVTAVSHDLPLSSAIVLLDGNHDYLSAVHPDPVRVQSVTKGDRDCASIAAASVIAKVARDTLMADLHAEYPAYGWDRNKGYASAAHRQAIRDLGLTPHHRASWTLKDAPALF